MQDRPTVLELLGAVREFVTRHVVPAFEGGKQFHARVAANVLAIVERELRSDEEQLRAEWARLRALCAAPDDDAAADDAPPPDPTVLRAAVGALTAELAARIRNGDADAGPFHAHVLAHLRATAVEKLRIANPSYLDDASRA